MNQVVDYSIQTELSSKPLVSIIVPFLNTHKFIAESIESILSQRHSNWELFLVDDGSSDGSTEIAQQYAQKYPQKIHYLEHEGHQNRGASASRNLALRNANGKYISFLDADDVWLPSNLENLVTNLETHPEAGMVYGTTQWWYGWTGNPEDIANDFVGELGIQPNTLVKPPELFIPFFLTQTLNTPCMCSLLIRREVLKSIDGFEENFRYIYTDQVFYSKLALNVPILVISECGAKYRQHPNSSCSVVYKTGQAFAAREKFLHWVENYLSAQKVEDPQIWQELEKALWPHKHPLQHKLLTHIQHNVKRIKRRVKSIAR